MKKLTPAQAKKLRLILLLLIFAGVIAFLFFLATRLGNAFKDKQEKQDTLKQVFNARLPDANVPQNMKNKLETYMEAQNDSLKKKQLADRDPYFEQPLKDSSVAPDYNASAFAPPSSMYENERKVKTRLHELNRIMEEAKTQNASSQPAPEPPTDEIRQLEQMYQRSKPEPKEEDEEMKQVNAVLDKLITLQEPTAGRKGAKPGNSNKARFIVSAKPGDQPDSSLHFDIPAYLQGNGFFGLGAGEDSVAVNEASFSAVVHQNQTIQNGSTIKLRIKEDIYIKGIKVPRNSFVYGTCAIGDERIQITITNILFQKSVLPVRLAVFDSDGQEGIYVPGAVTRDIAADNADRAIQSIGLTALDPSLSAQAANAGVETAKSLLKRKIKNVTVNIKSGHTVLLRNTDYDN